MLTLPYSDKGLIIRTDFSRQSKWMQVCAAIDDPTNAFEVFAEFIDDPKYKNADIHDFPKFNINHSVHDLSCLLTNKLRCITNFLYCVST